MFVLVLRDLTLCPSLPNLTLQRHTGSPVCYPKNVECGRVMHLSRVSLLAAVPRPKKTPRRVRTFEDEIPSDGEVVRLSPLLTMPQILPFYRPNVESL